MVTAIVIPIICIYFFLLTRKEMKENDMKWKNSGHFNEEAIVEGVIKSISSEKQRFYYQRFIFVQELQVETGTSSTAVKKVTPITKDFVIEEFQIGKRYQFIGEWNQKYFCCNRYFSLDPVKDQKEAPV
ncbi:hypothetical protein [Neobacillus terrae]|uniref:hypothetical protein n=1 Tax=Neobacillus terrae TaxID=3034837 RepID=UPI00140AA2BB|nr:hypothetical protein [Neobacillus terrae]NHM29666.1 hypothetical protein [Neobacillus terrae]